MIWISLGRRCEVTWQIRHHFGVTHSYPFDWLVTPLQSIPLMLEENFENIINPKNLCVSPTFHPFRPEYIGETVVNNYYNIFLHHEFERKNNNIILDWKSSIDTIQSKYRHVIQSWKDALSSGEDIVLVRQGGRIELPSESPLSTLERDFLKVLETVQAQAKGQVHMLVVDAGGLNLDDRFIQVEIGTPNTSDWPDIDHFWKGSIARWGKALDHTQILLQK